MKIGDVVFIKPNRAFIREGYYTVIGKSDRLYFQAVNKDLPNSYMSLPHDVYNMLCDLGYVTTTEEVECQTPTSSQ